ncbi:hypothetical protein J7E18_03485 [Oceanobacillus sp. ISL-73]|uniref:hypothetical protein n=1 Tax=Oceanobacillus sp. ISL-74 TaxID=2819162 RepID=UPI001BE896F8|nr:hypothetical protein [Oceanobacillus sp. ISL-74]MBT2650926.1 hypothetical protein [Oceanobacillus sp. ISL-73]
MINYNENLDKEPIQYGIITQQLRESLLKCGVDVDDTSIVSMGDDGMYGVQHLQLIAPTIKYIQELSFKLDDEINWQRIEYTDLKNKVIKLEKRIEELKEQIA